MVAEEKVGGRAQGAGRLSEDGEGSIGRRKNRRKSRMAERTISAQKQLTEQLESPDLTDVCWFLLSVLT